MTRIPRWNGATSATSSERTGYRGRRGSCRRGKVDLEASGGITLETVRSVALTGVDRISIGAVTHSAPALDVGLDIEE